MLAPVNSARQGKRLKHQPMAALTFGRQQAPGSRADGCLWACLHCLGMASKCQEQFSHTRGSPVTSHPSQSLPLPHIQEPAHRIHDYFHVNTGLYIFTQCNATVHFYSCFSVWIITLEPCSSRQPSFFQKEDLQNENFLLKSSSVESPPALLILPVTSEGMGRHLNFQ